MSKERWAAISALLAKPLATWPAVTAALKDLYAEVLRLKAVENNHTMAAQLYEGAQKDVERLDTAQRLLVAMDTGWGAPDEKMTVVVLSVPDGVRVSGDFRAFLDAAMEGSRDA